MSDTDGRRRAERARRLPRLCVGGERRLHTVANLYAATESQRGDSDASRGL